MVATKIQNLEEALAWLREGKPYQWIVEEYLRKYNIETVPSLWGNLRRKHGIPRRLVRNDDLIRGSSTSSTATSSPPRCCGPRRVSVRARS